MSDKEWQKVVFSDEKKFNLDCPDGFQKYWHTKNFSEENYSTRHRGGGSLMIWRAFSSSGKLKLQFINGWKTLNNLSLAQEGCHLCGEEWIFQQDNAAIHNESITKKYLLEQKIKLDHSASFPDINTIENLWGLIVEKCLWRRSTVLSNFWTQKYNLRCMGKIT